MKNILASLFFLLASIFAPRLAAQIEIPTNDPPQYGPYNGTFLAGGDGLKKQMVKTDTVLRADSLWSFWAWVRMDEAPQGAILLAGIGEWDAEYARYIGVDGDKLVYWGGKDLSLSGNAKLDPGQWHLVGATFDGQIFHLYAEGAQVAEGKLDFGRVSPLLEIAPAQFPVQDNRHFAGKMAGITLVRRALSANEFKELAAKPPAFSTLLYEEGSKPWPVQTREQDGYRAPQDPELMPKTKAAFSRPQKSPVPQTETGVVPGEGHQWTISGRWKLRPAPEVPDNGEALSQSNYNASSWWDAVVPGTVLTTMVAQGVYPDPDYGLNNLVIPETLNKQDYWYRSEFTGPADWKGERLTLTFEGINYAAEVWLNGKELGTIRGAFIRGVFDVTDAIQPGARNVLAVRVSPPPHPGIPHEQSLRAGAGENGGMMCLDGPTFVDTEGWDWIPGIRDRDTGIWQAVTVRATSAVRIGDPQVVTKLPLPDTSRADVEITVPLENAASAAVNAKLTASFEGVTISKTITLAPGKTELKLAPAEFPQLQVQHPRLWWPNGYGKPELCTLKLNVEVDDKPSDAKQLRFGIRELTYEISLLNSNGKLERIDYSPTVARVLNQQVVDITHNGIRNVPSTDPYPSVYPEEWKESLKWWVASLRPGMEKSPAVKQVDDTRATPFLTIRVNGVRIAARGGSWGMDDSRKRVSRERLEPYFRLHRDANVNIIRNWVGQSTEEV